MMKTFRIKSFSHFISIVLNNGNGKTRLYRGQMDDKPLFPKLHRLINKYNSVTSFYEIEHRIFNEFKRMSSLCNINIRSYSEIEQWSMAQHFGLPTRLLDWSTNPLTALWFAFESEKKNEDDRVVWGLVVQDEFITNSFNNGSIKAYKPNYIDPRMNVQNAWFTIHGVDYERHTDSKGDGLPHFNSIRPQMSPLNDLEEMQYDLAKFVFSNDLRDDILNQLDIFGINYFSLFPDLTGLCKNIEWKEFYKNEAP